MISRRHSTQELFSSFLNYKQLEQPDFQEEIKKRHKYPFRLATYSYPKSVSNISSLAKKSWKPTHHQPM